MDNICYVERSRVREILIGVADEDVDLAEHFLAQIDALPIITGSRPEGEAMSTDDLKATRLRSGNNYCWHCSLGDKMLEELENKDAETSLLRGEAEALDRSHKDLGHRLAEAGRENAKLRETLAYYADPFAWKKAHDPDDDMRIPDFYSEMEFGDKAREALEQETKP